MGKGKNVFISNGCPVSDCYVTSDEGDVDTFGDFDAVLFHVLDVWPINVATANRKRRPHQR